MQLGLGGVTACCSAHDSECATVALTWNLCPPLHLPQHAGPFLALHVPLKLIPSLATFLQRWMRTLHWPNKTAAFISRLSERMKDLGQQDRCCSSDQCPRCVLTGFAWRSWIKRVPGLCQWHCGERGVKTRLWAGNANRMRAGLEGLAVVSRVHLL